jgi:hypothetical protein
MKRFMKNFITSWNDFRQGDDDDDDDNDDDDW